MNKKAGSIVYKCRECGATQPKWLGRCPQCGQWNSLEEAIVDPNAMTPGRAAKSGQTVATKIRPVPLDTVDAMEGGRISTGLAEFDRVLGGGATKRSVILLGGEPGIGKSTLLLQTVASVAAQNLPGRILYISGEESAAQIKNRALRLNVKTSGIEILCTTRLEDALDALDNLNPGFIIVDSIQTMYSVEAGAIPGTVNQLKYCANELISWVKERESVMIMTAHVTKEGTLAGPKSLEHLVDTVISFERNEEDVRFLRAQKNRFGSIDELGIFEMTESGLKEVQDSASLFITRREGQLPAGIAYVPVFEGSRVFLVEIQALTVPAKASLSRVYSEHVDSGRVARIAAVLEKRAGIQFSSYDLYINVAGGIHLSEPAIDAALAAALYSARTDLALPANTAFTGELSLAGEIRPVSKLRQRVKTAREMGFSTVIAPEAESGAQTAASLKQLLTLAFGK